jgi:hypothetical protein
LHGTKENKENTQYTRSYFFLLASSSSRYKGKIRQQLQLGKIDVGSYLGSTQLALTFVPSTELGVAKGPSSVEVALLLGDFAWCLDGERRWKGHVDAGGGGIEVITLYRFKQ